MPAPAPWQVHWCAGPGCVEIVYAGQVSADELAASVEAALDLARAHGGTRYLTDCSALAGGHSVVDLYRLAERLTARGLGAGLREAVILPTAVRYAPDATFWRDAGRNRGLEVEVFPDRAAALAWLAREDRT